MVSVGGDWPEKNKNIFVVSSTNAESNPVLCELAKDHNIGIVVATHDLKYADKLDAVFCIENGELKLT